MNVKDHIELTGLINMEKEACGTIENGKIILQTLFENESRDNCDYKHKRGIIWHTHNKDGKSYPSAEDILSVLRNSNVHMSLVFTKLGVYLMKSYNKKEVSERNFHNIKMILDKLYSKLYKKVPKEERCNVELDSNSYLDIEQMIDTLAEFADKTGHKLYIRFYPLIRFSDIRLEYDDYIRNAVN
jgi:hypothetical protein